MFKKITAILLALIFCLCAVGCTETDPDAPEGMKSATVEGEPFVLYVPESWTLNTASGTSGAYYSAVEGLFVAARYYTPAEPTTKEVYLDECASALGLEYAEAEFLLVDNKVAATLGGKDALRIGYEIEQNGATLRVSHICAEADGMLISLYLYCPKAELEARSQVLEEIRGAFRIVGKSDIQYEAVTTKDTPDGMKLASNEDIEYRFFVPTSWVCNPKSGANEAYYPESGRPNVTVTSFVPEISMSINEYFLKCESEYKNEFSDYVRTGEGVERKVDGKVAYSYTYTLTAEGRSIKIMQTVFVHDSSFYTITYTALAENFDVHVEDVEKIIGAFRFR